MPLPPALVSRDLSSLFRRVRRDRRQKRLGSEQVGTYLLACDEPEPAAAADVVVEMKTLPPQWVESAEDAREDIKAIKEKLVLLTKAHQKRLLKVFGDDAAPDKEVEAIAGQITALVRSAEQRIHQVKTRGSADLSDRDREFRQNVQRSLAASLQQLSQQFKQTQKVYLNEIRKRQRGSRWDEPASNGGNGKSMDMGFSNTQMQELESMEIDASQRSEEICHIAASISELHTVFKDLAALVIDQGSILDRIDYNIDQVLIQTEEANVQIKTAEKSAKSNRSMKCILILVVLNLILIAVLVIKARH